METASPKISDIPANTKEESKEGTKEEPKVEKVEESKEGNKEESKVVTEEKSKEKLAVNNFPVIIGATDSEVPLVTISIISYQ